MKPILIPIQNINKDLPVVKTGVLLSRLLERPLFFLHIVNYTMTATYMSRHVPEANRNAVLESMKEPARQKLEFLCSKLKFENPNLPQLIYKVWNGIPEDVILNCMPSIQPAFLLLESDAEATWWNYLTGTLSTRIARKASVPVMVLPRTARPEQLSTVNYVGEFNPKKRNQIGKLLPIVRGLNGLLNISEIITDKVPTDFNALQFVENLRLKFSYPHINYRLLPTDDLGEGILNQLQENTDALSVIHTRDTNLFRKITGQDLTAKAVLETEDPLLLL